MEMQRPAEVTCPYCGETVELLVDCSAGAHEYVEDCRVCCRPITVSVMIDMNGDPFVHARREDD